MTDYSALIERLDSHMGKADMAEVLADCRKAAAALRDIEGERSVEYVIYQDDVMVAGSDREDDIRHYASVYGQDGLVQVFKVVSFASTLPSAPSQAKEAGE